MATHSAPRRAAAAIPGRVSRRTALGQGAAATLAGSKEFLWVPGASRPSKS